MTFGMKFGSWAWELRRDLDRLLDAREGTACGAISGAVMAIGASNKDNTAGVAALTKQCTAAFREKYGNLRCLDLKRAGVSCDELIAFGAETAEKLINIKK